MALSLGELSYLIALSDKTFQRDATKAGEKAGKAVGDGIEDGTDKATKAAATQLDAVMVKAAAKVGDMAGAELGKGIEAGARDGADLGGKRLAEGIAEGVGDGLKQGADGKWRDARGRFVKVGEDAGQVLGDGIEQGVSDGSDSAAGKMSNAIVAGAAGAAAVAGAVIVDVLSQALERADVENKLAAALGGFGGAVAAGMPSELFADNFGSSVEDAAESVRLSLRSGLLPPGATKKDVRRINELALSIRDAFGEDLGKIFTAAGSMVRSGMVPDFESAFDLMTVGLRSTANRSDDLLDTFSEYSGYFSDLGIDGPTALLLISQAMEAGAWDTDKAADAFKEFGIRGKDGTDAVRKGYQDLGLDADVMMGLVAAGGDKAKFALGLVLDKLRDVKDPVDRNTTAVALFGTQAEDLQASLYAMDLTAPVAQIESVGGASSKLSDQLSGSDSAKIESWKRRAKDHVLDLGDSFLLALADFDTFKERFMLGLQAAANWVAPMTSRIVGTVSGMWGSLMSGVSTAGAWISERVVDLISLFGQVPGWLARALGGVAYSITSPFRTAFRWIAELWNRTVGSISFKMPDWAPLGLGGKGFDVPNIPEFHTGGIFSSGIGPIGEGLALLQNGEGVFTRDQMAAMGGGRGGGGGGRGVSVSQTIAPVFPGVVAGRDAEQWISETVRSAARRGVLQARDLPGAA